MPIVASPHTPSNLFGGHLVSGLNLLLFGGILCFIDLNIETNGLNIDLVPDVIGYPLVIWGLAVLRYAPLTGYYHGRLGFTRFVVLFGFLVSVAEIWVDRESHAWSLVLGFLAIALAAGAMTFCGAMMQLARHVGAEKSRESFRSSRAWIGLLLLGPLAALQLWALMADTPRIRLEFGTEAGWIAIVVMFIVLLPMVSLFSSVRRLRQDLLSAQRNG